MSSSLAKVTSMLANSLLWGCAYGLIIDDALWSTPNKATGAEGAQGGCLSKVAATCNFHKSEFQ